MYLESSILFFFPLVKIERFFSHSSSFFFQRALAPSLTNISRTHARNDGVSSAALPGLFLLVCRDRRRTRRDIWDERRARSRWLEREYEEEEEIKMS